MLEFRPEPVRWLDALATRTLLHRPRASAELSSTGCRTISTPSSSARSGDRQPLLGDRLARGAHRGVAVRAARKSSRSSANSSDGETARTVAVRGTSRSSAISPKKSPRCARACGAVRDLELAVCRRCRSGRPCRRRGRRPRPAATSTRDQPSRDVLLRDDVRAASKSGTRVDERPARRPGRATSRSMATQPPPD